MSISETRRPFQFVEGKEQADANGAKAETSTKTEIRRADSTRERDGYRTQTTTTN
jgi:hypothetical protein